MVKDVDEVSARELALLLTSTAELYFAARPRGQWHTGARAAVLRGYLENLFDLMGDAGDAIDKISAREELSKLG